MSRIDRVTGRRNRLVGYTLVVAVISLVLTFSPRVSEFGVYPVAIGVGGVLVGRIRRVETRATYRIWFVGYVLGVVGSFVVAMGLVVFYLGFSVNHAIRFVGIYLSFGWLAVAVGSLAGLFAVELINTFL